MINPAPFSPFRAGIDLGGTKTEIIVLDAAGGERLRRRAPTPQGNYEATLDLVASLVRAAELELGGCCSVGVGTPGALSLVDSVVKNANSTCLNGRALKSDLEARIGREVRLANDANCFVLSEAVDGAAAGARSVFGVILGTGVGGGIVIGGELLVGANAIAGEWGHNPLPSPSQGDHPLPLCYCGRTGCIETFLSGPALSRDHFARTAQSLSAEDIAGRAEAGDVACAATLARYEERLARSLASVVNVLDPEVIVLGGGLSNIGRLYRNVPVLWGKHVFSDHIVTRLVRNRHGDSSGVRGAARLWPAASGPLSPS